MTHKGLAKRIIPCLDVKNGETVKGTNFVNLRSAGNPVELGKAYSEAGADELVYLDITASFEGRKTFTDMVTCVAREINIPFTVGGGINSLEDVERLLYAGADKISVNSAAIRNPNLFNEIARNFGSQVCVCAISLSIPVIASGGAGTMEHFKEAATIGKADAMLAASVFHFGQIKIGELKHYLADEGINVRI